MHPKIFEVPVQEVPRRGTVRENEQRICHDNSPDSCTETTIVLANEIPIVKQKLSERKSCLIVCLTRKRLEFRDVIEMGLRTSW